MNPQLLSIQQNELTEYWIYKKIAPVVKNLKDRVIIERMAAEEWSHYQLWKEVTKQDVKPNQWRIWFYYGVTRLFGLSFGLKLMEKGEKLVGGLYQGMIKDYPQIATMISEEQEHEQAILNMINHQVLANVSAVILGLNDAIVEITGALAGLTLALASTRLIGTVTLITGIAGSLSMGISSYLSAESEKDRQGKALLLGTTTGISYFLTVIVLVLPYFLISTALFALPISLLLAIIIIFLFNFYTSVSLHQPFTKRFRQMLILSLGAAVINFGIGFLIKRYFGV